nr:hypothetical protein [Tanacetum cinerariifolium]
WRFPPRGRALDDLEALVSHIGNLSLSIDEDKWSSSRDASGSFKVLVIPFDWNSWISWPWSIVDKSGIASVQ